MNLFRYILAAWMILCVCALHAQTQYISHSRCVEEDRFEDLAGDGGVILLSKHKDLVIALPNVKNKSIRLVGERPDGYYEYCVIIKAGETRTPKLEISRRGSVYKTELVQKVKPDFLIAYRVEEVQNPIWKDEQTQSNDAYLDANFAVLELSTTIKDLKVECHPDLNAVVESKVSTADPNISIVTVKIPVISLTGARELIEKTEREYTAQKNKLDNMAEAPDAEWDLLDKLELAKDSLANSFKQMTNIGIHAAGTNWLTVEVGDLGPRAKKCYAVLPIVVEKNVYVTQCSAFMNEGGKLFGMRKYKEARLAYEDAWNSEDVIATLRPAIRESIAQCDSCMLYESLAAGAIKKIAELKKNGGATQEEVARYASAAVEFMEMVNAYNPDDFYRTRIERMKNLLSGMPLKIRFTVVEWRTLQEGNKIPGVEVWAYKGLSPVSSNTFSSDKRFEKLLERNVVDYTQIGVSDENGLVEVDLDRTELPQGILFRPSKDSKIKIKYMTIAELMQQAQGTYMEKQFRLKMYVK